MKKLDENLSKALDIEPIDYDIIDAVPVTVSDSTVLETKNQIDDDADFARKNLRDLITKGNQAADHIIQVAKQSDHPRAFEVVSGMLKNLADMNKDLLDLQKKKQDLQPKETTNKGGQGINVNQAVFVGSTTDLIKQLRGNK